jgi:hypothetical protein
MQKNLKTLMQKTCPTCKRQFYTATNKKLFCSYWCYPSTKPRLFACVCIVCGKPFSGSRTQKICGVECFLKRNRERALLVSKALHEARVKARPKEKCLWCHEVYIQTTSIQVYCNPQCGYEYNRMQRHIMKNTDLEHEEIELSKLRKEGKFYEEKSKIEC